MMYFRRLLGFLWKTLLLASSGAVSVFSFSPLEIPGLIYFALGMLFLIWGQTASKWYATAAGFTFGLGYFIANVHWIFLSMYRFGGMPAWMAAACVLGFSAYLAIFPALAGFLGRWLPWPEKTRYLLFPSLFILTEWLRGWLFTGFPWASIGTSQLALFQGWFPLLGVYGVGWLVANIVAITLHYWQKGLLLGLCTVLIGLAFSIVEWTPLSGKTLTVSLVQGGIPQTIRWDPAYAQKTRDHYIDLVSQTKGQLVVLPEAAIPELLSDTPKADIARLRQVVEDRGGALVSGYITGNEQAYFNSVIRLGDRHQIYSKHHLLPFGEYVPLPWLFGWMYHYLNMPMSGFEPGARIQPPIDIGFSKIGANVCYEDIFGNQIRTNARDATLLVNVSNMAWFDGSWAAEQHLQMARARALENGRWTLTATNTGTTAIINHDGHVMAYLPKYKAAVLEGSAENRVGETPYTRWGDTPIVIFILSSLLFGSVWAWYKRARL